VTQNLHYLFKQATAAHDPHRQGWTLHQFRHSALLHLAADGRTAPESQISVSAIVWRIRGEVQQLDA
jgi:hypothetical protein